MRAPASQILTRYVLDHIETETLARRIELYTALADFAPTPPIAKAFRSVAADLAEVQRKHDQLVLDFHRTAL